MRKPAKNSAGSGRRAAADSQYVFCFIKPGFEHLEPSIRWHLNREGLQIAAKKTGRMTEAVHEAHYYQHRKKKFYGAMVRYFVDVPLKMFVVSGPGAVEKVREILGPTDSETARRRAPGSLRGMYGKNIMENVMHASDSREAAANEMLRFFSAGELSQKQLRFALKHASLDSLPAGTRAAVAPHLFKLFEPRKLSPAQLRFALKHTPMDYVPRRARDYVLSEVPFWQLPWRAKWRAAWWRLSGKNPA